MDISLYLQELYPVPLNFVETDSDPVTTDVIKQCGSTEKIKSKYGFAPEIIWKDSLRDLWHTYQ